METIANTNGRRATAEKRLNRFKHFSVVLIAFLVSGCIGNAGEKNQSTISVVGTGTVFVSPDMIKMSISLSNTASTTKAAQEEVNKMVRQALAVLKEFGIEDKNIITAALRFSQDQEYDYGRRRHILIGQNVEQTITFSVNDIHDDNEKVSQIIDRLVQINGIELNWINFDVKNSVEYFERSRELAFQKAAAKAQQYAELSGRKIAKVLSVAEAESKYIRPRNNNSLSGGLDMVAPSGSTTLPSGELEVTSEIMVVFLLK